MNFNTQKNMWGKKTSFIKINLENRLWCCGFFQKTNKMHSGYYPECVLFVFLEEVMARKFCLEINWPLVDFKSMVNISSIFVAFLENMNFNCCCNPLLCSIGMLSKSKTFTMITAVLLPLVHLCSWIWVRVSILPRNQIEYIYCKLLRQCTRLV